MTRGLRHPPRTGKAGKQSAASHHARHVKPRESKSLLVLFFRKEQNLLFLKKKKQKDF
jgi:hypothetical protein